MATELDTDLILLHLVQTRPDGPVVWPVCHLQSLVRKARMPATSYTEANLVELLRRDAPAHTGRTAHLPQYKKGPDTLS